MSLHVSKLQCIMYCTCQATVHKARIQEIAVYALNGAIWEKPPYAQVMYITNMNIQMPLFNLKKY